MRTEIAKLHNRIGVTTIYVTHDQTEAMTMADRIVVLRDGKVQQIATPQIMYDQPVNVFVAGFIGSPAMNFIAARLEKENGGHEVVFGNTRLPLTQEALGGAREKGYDPESFTGKDVILGIRPEHIEDAGTEAAEAIGGSDGANTMEVEPQVLESMGSEKYLYFEVEGEQAAHLESLGDLTDDETSGDDDGGGSADESGEMMVARVAAESAAKEGQRMSLVIDSSKVQLFDPESEQAIF
jgi:multiple sugar transport system ATP-binding protein